VAWQTTETVEQYCHQISESKRLRLASVHIWPNKPHLDIGYLLWRGSGFVNAKGFFRGLAHHADHKTR
jgi:hypothetical protein